MGEEFDTTKNFQGSQYLGCRPIPADARCIADPDCDSRVVSVGLCRRHYNERYRAGMVAPKHERTHVGIFAAHQRCRALWGPASAHICIECGGYAYDWAYDGTDPAEKLDGILRYSVHPEFYMPMCRGCHQRRDARERTRELLEYRKLRLLMLAA